MAKSSVERLQLVAAGLGELIEKFVFVGGAVTGLYATHPAAPETRPTLDVDCVVKIASRSAFGRLESALRNKGFVNDTREGAPLCSLFRCLEARNDEESR